MSKNVKQEQRYKSPIPTRYRDMQCFKCRGVGNMAYECPYRRAMLSKPDGLYATGESIK